MNRRLTAEGILALVTLVSVAFFRTEPSHNEWAHWAPAVSWLRSGTWAIDAWADRETVDWSEYGGHRYSNKAPGLSMLAVPVLAALPDDPKRAFPVANLLLNGLPAVAMAVAMFRVARSLVPDDRVAFLTAGAGALATMSLPFATAFYQHQMVASFLFLSFALLHFGKLPLLAGALAGLAVLCDYPAALAVAGLAAYAFSRSRAAAALFVAGGLPFVAPLLVYHATCFGSPWTLPQTRMNPIMHGPELWLGMFGPPYLEAVPHLTVTPYRGLFFTAPHLLAAAFGLWILWKNKHRAEALLAAGILAAFFALNVSFHLWHGGGTYAPRYLLPAVPFLSLGLAPVLERRLAWAWLALPGLAIGLATTATGLCIPPEFRYPLFQWTLPRVWNGGVETTNLAGLPAPWSLLPLAALWAWGARAALRKPA